MRRHVHIGHRAHVDAVVGAEGAAHGLVPPVVIGGRRGLRHRFGPPQLGAANAVLEPALHRAAQARAGVLLDRARELVVAARHRVDHEGGDGRLLRAEVAAAEVGDDRREREAGAGVGALLVQDRQRDLPVRMHPVRGWPRHRRQVAPVAQVELVGDDVALELARSGPGRLAAARLGCHRGPPSRRRRRGGETSARVPVHGRSAIRQMDYGGLRSGHPTAPLRLIDPLRRRRKLRQLRRRPDRPPDQLPAAVRAHTM